MSSKIRLYFSSVIKSELVSHLTREQSYYIKSVMRLNPGDIFSVFNSQGEWNAKIENYQKKIANIKILKKVRDKVNEKEIKPLIKKIKKILGERVKDVKISNRLSDSPSCLVADENDPTSQMQEIMKAMGQSGVPDVKPILEINPDHEIVSKLSDIQLVSKYTAHWFNNLSPSLSNSSDKSFV